MKVIYGSILGLIDRHIRDAALMDRAIQKIELTNRTEVRDLHSELYAMNNRIFPALVEFVPLGNASYKGVLVEWPKEWGVL